MNMARAAFLHSKRSGNELCMLLCFATCMWLCCSMAEGSEKSAADSPGLSFPAPRFRPMATDVSGLDCTVIKLDGTWRIHPSPPEGFHAQPAEGPGWSDFTVPGQWLQQGFDIPRDKTAGVATTFEVPESWARKRIFLRFDAIHGGTDYWLNGQHLGTSENLFTPVEFEVTDAVLPGRHNRLVLAMKVDTPSETISFSSNYAFHNLGGIDRSVRLFVLPAIHIARLHYETILDEAYRDATLVLNTVIDNPGDAAVSGLSLGVQLEDPKGKAVSLRQSEFPLKGVKRGENAMAIRIPVTNPLKWNAEKPHLYHLSVRLMQGDTALETVEQTVGFRSIEIKNKQLYINGTLVKILGTGLHQVNPLSGRADTAKYAAEDVRLMKEANLNYTRTCHYPYPREFLDECDRQGLYVECEAPFCWSAGNNDLKMVEYFLAGTAAMVEYNRDHPSIIIWSLLNETPFGQCFVETFKFVRKQDPSRLITNQERAGDCEISGWHYGPFPFDDHPDVRDIPRPTLYGEYMPIMSDHFPEQYELNPGLDVTWSEGQNSNSSYVSQLQHSPHVIGGAMWGLIDDEFVFADRSTKGYGRWGLIDAWRRPKSTWWDCKLMHSPAWVPVREIEWSPGQRSVTVPVENRYSFTDLGELRCTWEVNGVSGTCELDVPPRTNGTIPVSIQRGTKVGDRITLRFEDARGVLVSAHGVRLVGPSKQYFTFSGTSKMKTRTIKMDGEFSEWKDVPELTVDEFAEKAGDAKEGNDIENVWMAADDDNLYFCIQCARAITKPSTWSPTFVVVDIDSDAATGYPSKPLGIDYLVQPFSEGRTDLMIHRRRADANHKGWSAWHDAVIVADAYVVGRGEQSDRVELRVPWKALGIADAPDARFRFRVEDGSIGLYPDSGDWAPNSEGQRAMPAPTAGRPDWSDDGKVIRVRGDSFMLKLDKLNGRLLDVEGGKQVPLIELPSPFFARAEPLNMRGPHKPQGLPYAEYPDPKTRKVGSLTIEERDRAVAIVVDESYTDFKGSCVLLVDTAGRAMVTYEYEYTGERFTAGEMGLRFLVDETCREIRWRRNAEWDVYPEDHIGRAIGIATAERPDSKGEIEYPPFLKRPPWSWALDENEFGTRDFRGTKHHICEAALLAPDGSGIRVDSDGTTTDVRANLSADGVEFHVLNGFKPARPMGGGYHLWHFRSIGTGYTLSGRFSIQLLAAGGN